MNGILLINKDKDWTSHDVVAKTRGLFNLKKVGHAGTLDPMATGVLPICIGKATRVAEYISGNRKSYVAEAEIGYSTTTYDITGEKINFSEKDFDNSELKNILGQFLGEIEQVPPMYSAIKVKGKKLYEYARKGIEIERKARIINIYDLKLLNYDKDSFKLYIECSSGTYIRSLIHDIGCLLGTFATMSSLVRSSVGNFKLEDTYTISQIESMTMEERKSSLLSIEQGVDYLPKIELTNFQGFDAKNGKKIPIKNHEVNKLYRVYSDADFIGLGFCVETSTTQYLQMKKVFK